MKKLKPAIVNTKSEALAASRSHNRSFKSAFAAGKIDADKEGARSPSSAHLGKYTPEGKSGALSGSRSHNLEAKSSFVSRKTRGVKI